MNGWVWGKRNELIKEWMNKGRDKWIDKRMDEYTGDERY